ncbi:MAG: SH3 domain-containing protein [Planctomycetota bacterium]
MREVVAGIVLMGLAGWVAAEEATSYTGEVSATQLRLRAGPGEGYQEVVRLPQGAKVVVLGRHPNDPTWLVVEVPQGYSAWVFGKFLAKREDGGGAVTGDRVAIRPRPSTRYHQLAGYFAKGDEVKVLGEKSTDEGLWYEVSVPRSVPLYAHGDYLKNIGPAAMAEEAAKSATSPAPEAPPAEPEGDRQVRELEPRVRDAIAGGRDKEQVEALRGELLGIDRADLSPDMRELRLQLVADLMDSEKQALIAELKAKEELVKSELDKKLAEIERSYKQRLAEIKAEFEREKKPRYVATGIVLWKPDLFGRYPSYRVEEAGRMRYFLIAPAYDLGKFVGKRVGVIGLADPESGTGHFTVMVKRIEILGEE